MIQPSLGGMRADIELRGQCFPPFAAATATFALKAGFGFDVVVSVSCFLLTASGRIQAEVPLTKAVKIVCASAARVT
jgi:hypothetical protein